MSLADTKRLRGPKSASKAIGSDLPAIRGGAHKRRPGENSTVAHDLRMFKIYYIRDIQDIQGILNIFYVLAKVASFMKMAVPRDAC